MLVRCGQSIASNTDTGLENLSAHLTIPTMKLILIKFTPSNKFGHDNYLKFD